MLTLEPILRSAPPIWADATWIGQTEIADITTATDIELADAEGYRNARILLRHNGFPHEFVETPISTHGRIDRSLLLEQCTGLDDQDLPGAAAEPTYPPISVVVCTHRRPQLLADALASLRAIDYPDCQALNWEALNWEALNWEIVVVDNAPHDDSTAKVVEGLNDPRIRYVCEPRAGLSFARNTGLRHARHDIVAFTDDDVIADRGWLRGIALGFTRDTNVAAVTGIVPSSEIRTPAQAYLDRRIRWSRTLRPRLFDISNPPPELPLFPFHLGDYGTGANFAVRASVVAQLGGFDEALGAGVATEGGEDLDLFLRIILDGKQIAMEPAALIWHRHRDTDEAMMSQARAYGIGLGAVLTKHALRPRSASVAARVLMTRGPAVLRHAQEYGAVAHLPDKVTLPIPADVGRVELRAVIRGPARLLRARRALNRRTEV